MACYSISSLLVPSQYMCPKASEAQQKIYQALPSNRFTIEEFEIPIEHSNTFIKGLIYYPKKCDPQDTNRCILYHNPNGTTVSSYFSDNGFDRTPKKLMDAAQCPIIMYDYRGTGLSSDNKGLFGSKFVPNSSSLIQDGEAALAFALNKFEKVIVAGSSLGGGIATISLDHFFQNQSKKPIRSLENRVQLINHDSFSSISNVVFPNSNLVGWITRCLGVQLNAAASMERLIDRKIPITVLCHTNDSVIREGSRMAEMIESHPKSPNVQVIYSSNGYHAELSSEMLKNLKI